MCFEEIDCQRCASLEMWRVVLPLRWKIRRERIEQTDLGNRLEN
jgi:hypothetical protein